MQKFKLCSQIADTLLILIGVAVALEIIANWHYTVVTPFQLGMSEQMSLLFSNGWGKWPNHSIG